MTWLDKCWVLALVLSSMIACQHRFISYESHTYDPHQSSVRQHGISQKEDRKSLELPVLSMSSIEGSEEF